MKDFPECRLVCTAKAAQMLPQFAAGISPERIVAVREDDTLDTGCRQLTFLMAPMVHWPEVMVMYDPMSSTLFSADAFGTFGTALALQGASGELSGATLVSDWRGEARRYYANICGKYGAQVQALLKKVSALDIARLCPLHGPVIHLSEFNPVPLYDRWSNWEPEDNGCVIFVAARRHSRRGIRTGDHAGRSGSGDPCVRYDGGRPCGSCQSGFRQQGTCLHVSDV